MQHRTDGMVAFTSEETETLDEAQSVGESLREM